MIDDMRMINGLKPLDDGRRIYLSPEEVLESLRKRVSRAPEMSPSLPSPVLPLPAPREGLYIEEQKDNGLFVVRNVVVDAGKLQGNWDVGWSEELFDNGKSYTQDDFVKFTLQPAYVQQGLRLAPGPLYHASIADVLEYATKATGQQKILAGKLISLFKKDFNPENLNYMMTCSRLVYMPAGQKDKVVHGYGYPDPVEEVLDFVGPSGLEITDKSNLENEIEALLGARNCTRVNHVYDALTGKKPTLWRLSSKPTSKDERALVLGCVVNGFYVFAIDYIFNVRPARGLVARRAQKISI